MQCNTIRIRYKTTQFYSIQHKTKRNDTIRYDTTQNQNQTKAGFFLHLLRRCRPRKLLGFFAWILCHYPCLDHYPYHQSRQDFRFLFHHLTERKDLKARARKEQDKNRKDKARRRERDEKRKRRKKDEKQMK